MLRDVPVLRIFRKDHKTPGIIMIIMVIMVLIYPSRITGLAVVIW